MQTKAIVCCASKVPLLQCTQHVLAKHCKLTPAGPYVTADFACRKRGCYMTVPDGLSHNVCKQCRPAPYPHVPDAEKRPGRCIAARCMNNYNTSHCTSAASTRSCLTTGNSWREEQRGKGRDGVKRHLGSIPSRRQASTDRGLVGSRLVALGSETNTRHSQTAAYRLGC